MQIRKDLAEQAVQKIADAMNLSVHEAAEGIIKIVNERMFGAVRLVSVEKGYDPRDFSLMAFGGAGPLHANALGILTQAWPVIVPPGPGILCAYGDATTRLRNEASKTILVRMTSADITSITDDLKALDRSARDTLLSSEADGSSALKDADITSEFEIDFRYSGQGLTLTVPVQLDDIAGGDFSKAAQAFDDLHEKLFTFKLDAEKELVNLRCVVQGPAANVAIGRTSATSGSVEDAFVADHEIYFEGAMHAARIYDRSKLSTGHEVVGPAVITEMDSTTVILPGHRATVDAQSNLLISVAE